MGDKNNSIQKPSYWHSAGTKPLFSLTVPELIDSAAEKWPDKEAFVCHYQGHRFTFKQIHEKACRFAAGLLKLGLNPGDQVAIWGPNCSEWYITKMALSRVGMVAVHVDVVYQQPHIEHILSKLDIKAMVFAPKVMIFNYYEILRAAIPELDDCGEKGEQLNSKKFPSLRTLVVMDDTKYRGVYCFNDVAETNDPDLLKRVREVKLQPDEDQTILFTSGTTGFPKAVVTSHYNTVNNAIFSTKESEYLDKFSRVVLPVHLCHVAANLFLCSALYYGYTIIVVAPLYEAKKTMEAITKERADLLFGPPIMFMDMKMTAKAEGIELPEIRSTLVGSAVLSRTVVKVMKEEFKIGTIITSYGMTEIAVITMAQLDEHADPISMGRVVQHTEVKIVDRNGEVVPMGTAGELWVRGHSVMKRYYADEENTRKFLGEDGWAKTGDEAVLLENGHLQITGRIKDIIIRFGINIYPPQLEEFLQKHPDIIEAQVFGVPDERLGEEVCAFLRLTPGSTLAEEDVRNYCQNEVSLNCTPKYVRFVTAFPRTTSGKVQKFKLLETLMAEIKNKKG